MRSLPVVGAVILGFGLLVFLSLFRQTRLHVYRESQGGSDFALELPRTWALEPSEDPEIEIVSGPLPSGVQGYLSLYHYGRLPLPPQQPGEAEALPWLGTLRMGPDGTIHSLSGHLEIGEVKFVAKTFGPHDLTDADAALMERVLMSVRRLAR